MEEYTFASSNTVHIPINVRMLVQLVQTSVNGIMMAKQRQYRRETMLVAIYDFGGAS